MLACHWRTLFGGDQTEATDAAKSEKLDPPFSCPPNWKHISEFSYDSDLKIMRLKNGLPNISREAQYIVAANYTVSIKLDGNRRSITIPKGTLTDFASVPRLFRIFVGRVGPHLEASILHDHLYVAWQPKCLTPNEQIRRFADELMLVAMNAAGMGCTARLIYWVVRLFGCITFFGKNPECGIAFNIDPLSG